MTAIGCQNICNTRSLTSFEVVALQDTPLQELNRDIASTQGRAKRSREVSFKMSMCRHSNADISDISLFVKIESRIGINGDYAVVWRENIHAHWAFRDDFLG